MAKKIYLEGGGDITKKENDNLDITALNEAENKKVYDLDLTSNNQEKIAKYRTYLEQYFKRLGAEEVAFVSNSQSLEEIRENLKEMGVVYIPGGDTEILLENLKKRKISPLLKNIESILIGNSAGAMALCREASCVSEDNLILKGYGLAELIIDVHYNKTNDNQLIKFSQSKKIYAIPEGGAIVINQKGELNLKGEIYLFFDGKKIKMNNLKLIN